MRGRVEGRVPYPHFGSVRIEAADASHSLFARNLVEVSVERLSVSPMMQSTNATQVPGLGRAGSNGLRARDYHPDEGFVVEWQIPLIPDAGLPGGRATTHSVPPGAGHLGSAVPVTGQPLRRGVARRRGVVGGE